MKDKQNNKIGKKAASKNIPNALTIKTIEEAHNGIGLEKPIKNIREFLNSL
jgi:hypothetical protein